MKVWWQRLSQSERRTIRLATSLLLIFLCVFGGLEAKTWLDHRVEKHELLTQRFTELNLEALKQLKKTKELNSLRSRWRLHRNAYQKDSKAVSHLRQSVARIAKKLGVQLKPTRQVAGGKFYSAILKVEATASLEISLQFVHQLQHLGFPVSLDRFVLQALKKSPGQVRFQFDLELHRLPKGYPRA